MSKLLHLLVLALMWSHSMSMASTNRQQMEEAPREELIEEMDIDAEDRSSDSSRLLRRLAGTPAQLSQGDRDALLNEHNHCRSLTAQGLTLNQPGAAYMEQLAWDSTLEDMAKAQTQTCVWSARGDLSGEYATRNGQNGNGPVRQSLYQITGMRVGSQEYIVSAVRSWYAKHSSYNYSTDSCAAGQYCGLYLNIVWASTRFVGCGYNVCNGATMVICNYLSGRTSGLPYPHVTGAGVCSDCPAGRQTCSNGLCSGSITATPTQAPAGQPTRQPTQTLAPTRAGQVSTCTGTVVTLTIGMKFGASTSGVTCQDYKAAFTSLFPCVQNYVSCAVTDYTGYPGWAKVGMKFESSQSVSSDIRTQLYAGQVRAGMRSYLESKGFVWGTR